MGFFARFRKKKKGKGKAAKSVEERGKLQELRFLRKLQETDPDLYKDLMLQRLGVKPQKDKDNLSIMVETVSKLKQAGIIVDPNASEGSEWKDILKSLGAGFGMAFMQSQMQGQQQPRVQEVVEEPPRRQYIPEPDSRAAIPESVGGTREEKVSFLVTMAKRELESRSPQAGAEWLMGLPIPQVKGLVSQIIGTPDTQLPVLMNNLANAYPDFAGLIDWLRQNPEKFIGIVHALRDMQVSQPQAKSKLGF